MKINILLLIVYFVYYVNAYTDEVIIMCHDKYTPIKKCLVSVKNKSKSGQSTIFLFSDYINCKDFNIDKPCIPTVKVQPLSDSENLPARILCVDREDNIISKCNMKSQTPGNYKDMLPIKAYSERNINQVHMILGISK